MEPRHHGTDGSTHDVRDLLVREALDVREVDRDAELLGDPLEGVLDVGVGQAVEGLRLGGAQPGRRVRLRARDLPVLDIVGLGLLGALALTRVMSGLLYGVAATDPSTFVANALLIESLGWVFSGAILFWGAAFALGSRHYVRDVIIAFVLSIGSWYLFALGLGIVLPPGILRGIL